MHLVPILDEGVTLVRDGHVIVLLDALDRDEVQREISSIAALLAQPRPAEEQQDSEH